MEFFKFKQDKAIVIIQMLLKAYGDEVGLHKLFKTLYFAEQKHLVRYGRPIVGDKYVAMKDGPVPSNIYDMMKHIRGDATNFTRGGFHDLQKMFKIVGKHKLQLLEEKLDKSIISISEKECLKESFEENKNLTFKVISEKSHDKAWKNADENNDISVILIASAGGAKEEFLKYIELNIENENLVF